MPNILAVPIDTLVEVTKEKIREKKRKNKEENTAQKRARVESIAGSGAAGL